MLDDYKYILYGYILNLNNEYESVIDEDYDWLTPINIKWDDKNIILNYLRRINK